ncbi:MAG: putative zinc-binding peptidase [Methylobacterium sp.]|uniref:zinc-binding metallopeptidase family protein n=1 Tax=Methylobacterium sp. TaxID=409 RepID=UPI0025D2EEBA|nr:putative zinc-binding peptidase [Methylobacterium sp.]MBX9932876.1 putative zinc-binding peptidase [Methylobacterium sp.]
MKLFQCQACGNILYFENRTCQRCGHRLAYLPETGTLSALEPLGGHDWRPLTLPERPSRFCVNAAYDACNWLVPPGSSEEFCLACRHNGTIPNVSDPSQLQGWRQIENAKHRLFYTLLRWNLPLRTRSEDPTHGLVFHFLSDPPAAGPKVMTGHDDGVITIALVEADDAEREKRRRAMGEPYRTLMGHFRHEIGHHYWDLLVRDGGVLDACRAMFGDDSQDYEDALKRHYAGGTPPDWQDHYVSAYATTHPWEDFAETWAHYLHIVDTLEMASAFGMQVRPLLDSSGALAARVGFDPYEADSIQQVVDAWLPFVFAINSVNRAMGQADLYPFVLAPPVIAKLGFIHDLVHRRL